MSNKLIRTATVLIRIEKNKKGVVKKVTRPKLWTKNFIMVCLTNLFLSMNFYLLMVIFSEYAVKRFDAPKVWLDLLQVSLFSEPSVPAR